MSTAIADTPTARAQAPIVVRRFPVAAAIAAALAFLILFAEPLRTLLRDWLHDPEASHGLLLGPIALWLAWRGGMVSEAQPRPWAGSLVLCVAVALRSASALAAELFTMRVSMVMALVAVIVFAYGWAQVRRWWLPIALLLLSVPLPAVVLGSLAFPLQFVASSIGAALLDWRHVPVRLTGNIIHLPGQALFVTEACSGLRSLTALISLGLLLGAFWLRSTWARCALLIITIPIAVLLNSVRVFVTGFIVYFVSPAAGEGVMHYTEGWVIFVFAFAAVNGVASMLALLERKPRGAAA